MHGDPSCFIFYLSKKIFFYPSYFRWDTNIFPLYYSDLKFEVEMPFLMKKKNPTKNKVSKSPSLENRLWRETPLGPLQAQAALRRHLVASTGMAAGLQIL